MRTYSHFIVTAAISQKFQYREAERRALLLGAIAPDIPLTVLTACYAIARKVMKPSVSQGWQDYDEIRCTDPAWVVSYNFFHAPLILILALWLGYCLGMKKGSTWAKLMFWFAVGCMAHTAVDMVTHNDDGPLALFPLNWQIRIKSPISYWDKRHGGIVFTLLEHVMDVMLCGAMLKKH